MPFFIMSCGNSDSSRTGKHIINAVDPIEPESKSNPCPNHLFCPEEDLTINEYNSENTNDFDQDGISNKLEMTEPFYGITKKQLVERDPIDGDSAKLNNSLSDECSVAELSEIASYHFGASKTIKLNNETNEVISVKYTMFSAEDAELLGKDPEVYNAKSLGIDSDGDGLTDYEEYYFTGTNPRLSDTDYDGIGDGVEVFGGDATAYSLRSRFFTEPDKRYSPLVADWVGNYTIFKEKKENYSIKISDIANTNHSDSPDVIDALDPTNHTVSDSETNAAIANPNCVLPY